MKLRVLEGERFSCHSCTNCCRDWHVEVTEGEIKRLGELAWPAGDELAGRGVFLKHGGKVFLAHRSDGSCIFLNPKNGLCRVHEQFGERSKPVGCLLYPFQITPTFKGEATVSARFDCPTVRRNAGAPHSRALPELRRIESELLLPSSFDEATCSGLSRDQMQAIVEFVATFLAAFPGDEGKALFVHRVAEVLSKVAPAELDRAALATAFPALKQQVEAAVEARVGRPGVATRVSFRTLLSQYLRRDEDVLNGKATRVGRVIGMARVVMGGGSLRSLGVGHPVGNVRRAGWFRGEFGAEAGAFEVFWRLAKIKLEAFQFMGHAAGGRTFFEGMRSLALAYAMTRAVARYSATGRGAREISAGDVDVATAAIDHAFGRSPVLNQPHARSLEAVLVAPAAFAGIMRHV